MTELEEPQNFKRGVCHGLWPLVQRQREQEHVNSDSENRDVLMTASLASPE